MNDALQTFLIGLPFLVIGLFGLWYCVRDSNRIHREITRIWTEAQSATTKEELENLHVSLQIFHAENGWHRFHGQHALKVLKFIRRRMKGRW